MILVSYQEVKKLQMSKSNFICSSCGFKSPKWLGKCPDCGSWNSFDEVKEEAPNKLNYRVDISQIDHKQSKKADIAIDSIEQILINISQQNEKRSYSFGNKEMDFFWGANGLVAGSLTLLAGEPGLGKSTFCLQLLRSLRKSNSEDLLYITAEESTFELARRSQRLKIPTDVLVLQANNLENICDIIEKRQTPIVVIDSVQTVYSSKIDSNPGSVAQVSTIASTLLSLSKSLNISIILVGHVTKDGQIAGPKTLEHLVDSVLMLEKSKNPTYRTLSFSKHRFGSTDNILLLKMDESGLSIVKDSSLALLENIENGVGVVYSIAMEKNLPLIVEVQALVNGSSFTKKDDDSNEQKSFFGRREVLGMPSAKLNTILAIMEKYLSINLKSYDVYIQIFGLPKSFYDESLDFAILLAILSSLNSLQIEFLYPKLLGKKIDLAGKNLFAGRMTLSGNLRKPTNLETREKTAIKLGFNLNEELTYKELKKLFVGN
jgi:DNA repair protein RadA/Sms